MKMGIWNSLLVGSTNKLARCYPLSTLNGKTHDVDLDLDGITKVILANTPPYSPSFSVMVESFSKVYG